jgi:hypothetical protein
MSAILYVSLARYLWSCSCRSNTLYSRLVSFKYLHSTFTGSITVDSACHAERRRTSDKHLPGTLGGLLYLLNHCASPHSKDTRGPNVFFHDRYQRNKCSRPKDMRGRIVLSHDGYQWNNCVLAPKIPEDPKWTQCIPSPQILFIGQSTCSPQKDQGTQCVLTHRYHRGPNVLSPQRPRRPTYQR